MAHRMSKHFLAFFCSATVVVVFVVVNIVGVVVWVRFVDATAHDPRSILSVFNRFPLFFQLPAIISVMSRILTMVGRWFLFFSVRVGGILPHRIHFQLIRGTQTTELYFPLNLL